MNNEYFLDNYPFVPSGLILLMSFLYVFFKKYSVSYLILLKHYNEEFMKHVLPRFCKPTTPILELVDSVIYSIKLSSSSSSLVLLHVLEWKFLSLYLHSSEQ